jgi:hypothetical protein
MEEAMKGLSLNPNAMNKVRRHPRMVGSRFKAVFCSTVVFLISAATAPGISSAIPIDTTDPTGVFNFPVPVIPFRDTKTAVGEDEGWGGLFISFNLLINKATFTVDPVLDDCVGVDPFPIKDGKVVALPAKSFLWKCNHGYQLDTVEHPGLNVTVRVEFDKNPGDPDLALLLDKADAADPTNTFWFTKVAIEGDTPSFFKNANYKGQVKVSAFAVPEPATAPLLLAALIVLAAVVSRRKAQANSHID